MVLTPFVIRPKRKPMYGKSTSIDNSISQNTKSVKNNNTTKQFMQNSKNNTKNVKDNASNIQDFGEKIGGARKDLAQPRIETKITKEVAHDYTVATTENGYSVNFKNKILKDGFKTQLDAEQYILDFKENIKNNMAFVEEGSNGKDEKRYAIKLRNPRTLKSEYIGKVFNNRLDAESYAIALSVYLKEHGKNLFRPQIQKVERINSNIRNAVKTTGNDILNNFGFKGGEFGNWVSQTERQEFLNYAQNAFTDLAIALDIDASSLGQNNEMNIAFGSRGKGLTGAVAHFEPEKRVINMTRLKGAGSLAHEYGHSIDNYLSRCGGYNENGMATTNIRNPKLSDNMKNAIDNVINAIKYNISTNQEEINKKNGIYEKGRRNSLNTHLSYLDNLFNGNQITYKYNKKTKQREQTKIAVTDEQKQKYQEIRKILEDGKLEAKRTFIGKSLSNNDFEYAAPIEKLKILYKEVVGRKINNDTIYWLYRYGQPTKQVTQIKSESAFSKSAVELDRTTGRKSSYYSKTEEMWARAFEAYVADKLKSKGITNTYLVHSVNNNEYALFNPFPAGEERNKINKAFDNLIQTMKEEGYYKFTNSKSPSIIKDDGIRAMKHNQDIRFAKKTAKAINKQNEELRNAEREGSYIEQEIQKIEATGNWDNSIPVTKMTDIKRTIENYLGIGIQKGHFRQQAYGIYKGTRDVLRTKELKDMDTILHETGHALDIGKRLKIDKESISTELLKAAKRYGGYEAETREVQLEEGFAEVIREYTIVPTQAKIDYPQTVAVLEGMRKQDRSFNDFITKVQEQTYNYIHQNPRNRTLSNVSIGDKTNKNKFSKEYIKQEVMRNIYDKDWAVKSAVNEIKKASGNKHNLKESENAYSLLRLTNGIGDKVTSMLANGYIDEYGNKLMPGLNQLGEILKNDEQRFNDLRAYLVAQRDLEYKAKTLMTGIRTMDSKAVVEQFKNDVQIQEASQLVYDTLNGVLQYAVNNHLISQEIANKLRKSNAFYVPMQRVLEGDRNNAGKRGAVADILKTRTGSELDIKDVLENIISNSSNIIQQVENNNVLKALYKQGEKAGLTGKIYDVIDAPMVKIGTAQLNMWEKELSNQGVNITDLDLNRTIDLFAPNNKVDQRNLITSFINDNGKRVYLQFSDEVLFNSLMNMDKTFMSKVLEINKTLNMPLRYGATMANIGFAIPNLISDTAQATIFSEAGFIPVLDNAIGVLEILSAQNASVRNFMNKVMPGYADRINTLYAIYEQTGATSSTRMSQYRESTQGTMKDIYGTKKLKTLGIEDKFIPLKRFMDLLTYIPEISEQSTRFRVFEKNLELYRNKGMDETDARIKAALQSRDATQDFGRTGNVTREINQLIPFSAARVGSAYTFAEKVKANTKQVAMRTAILIAVAMTIKAIGSDDDEIQELNQRKKDDNFVIRIGDSIVTIKKPQGILRSMINLTEYIQDLVSGNIEDGKEGERLAEWLKNTIMDNAPADEVTGLVPSAITPIVENFINKDLYYNSDIVKSYDLNLPDSEQYYDYNSQLAIWLGKIFNYSPAKIDNLISGYFAGLGTSITDIMDYTLGKLGITTEQPEMGAEDNPIGKRFIVNVNSNSSSVDEIYDLRTELKKKENGGTITATEKEQLQRIETAISNMSKLNKQIKAIKKDDSMSGSTKAEKIKILQEQKTDTARQALGKDLIHASNKSKINATQFYPSKDTLSKNKRTLTLNDTMKKEYEKVAIDYYKKYENQGLYSKEKLKEIKEKSKEYAKNYMMKKYSNKLENGK